MGSLNRIVLLGDIESPPEVKATTSGDSVANFTLFVERPPRQDGLASPSDKIKIVCWGPLADQVTSYTVGMTLLVEGPIHNRQYDDQSGVRHYVTEINVQDICLVGKKRDIISASPPESKSEPKLEPMPAPAENFDFSTSKPEGPLEVPPEFGEKVEEDIPF